jgi:hypothetical protein
VLDLIYGCSNLHACAVCPRLMVTVFALLYPAWLDYVTKRKTAKKLVMEAPRSERRIFSDAR